VTGDDVTETVRHVQAAGTLTGAGSSVVIRVSFPPERGAFFGLAVNERIGIIFLLFNFKGSPKYTF